MFIYNIPFWWTSKVRGLLTKCTTQILAETITRGSVNMYTGKNICNISNNDLIDDLRAFYMFEAPTANAARTRRLVLNITFY
jgi:hypothetical protein